MSDSKLTDDQRQNFASWLNSKAALIGKCPICGTRSWVLLEDIVEVRPFQGGNLTVGGAVYPYVGLMCTNCGNTNFINALVSGVLKAPEDLTHKETKPSGDSDG